MSHGSIPIDMYFKDILETFGTLYIPITKTGVGRMGGSMKNKILIVALVEAQSATEAEAERLRIYRLSFRVVDGDQFISNIGKNLSSTTVDAEKNAASTATATNYTELLVLPNTTINVTNVGGKISLSFSRIFTCGVNDDGQKKKITYYGYNGNNDTITQQDNSHYGSIYGTKESMMLSNNKHVDHNKNELVLTISPTFEKTDYLSLSTHFSKIQLLQIGLFVKAMIESSFEKSETTTINIFRPLKSRQDIIDLYSGMFTKIPRQKRGSTDGGIDTDGEIDRPPAPPPRPTQSRLSLEFQKELAMQKWHRSIKQSIKRLAPKKVYFNYTSIFVDLYFFWLEYGIINQNPRATSTTADRVAKFVVALALVVSASTGLGLLAELGMEAMSVANGSFLFNLGTDFATEAPMASSAIVIGALQPHATFSENPASGGGSLKYIKGKKSREKINKTRRKKQYSKRYKNTKKRTKKKRATKKRATKKRATKKRVTRKNTRYILT